MLFDSPYAVFTLFQRTLVLLMQHDGHGCGPKSCSNRSHIYEMVDGVPRVLLTVDIQRTKVALEFMMREKYTPDETVDIPVMVFQPATGGSVVVKGLKDAVALMNDMSGTDVDWRVDAQGEPIYWSIAKRDVDENRGLPSQFVMYDVDGTRRALSVDAIGRMSIWRPADGGAWETWMTFAPRRGRVYASVEFLFRDCLGPAAVRMCRHAKCFEWSVSLDGGEPAAYSVALDLMSL
jgi:hypothetical protein